MATVHEQLSERFYKWEQRGRGWQVFAEPIYPEPPFVPFEGHALPEEPVVDDGRRPTFLSPLIQRLGRKLRTEAQGPLELPPEEQTPEPLPLVRDSIVELQASLPERLDISSEATAHFLTSLALCREPLSFEILGAQKRVAVQFASHPADLALFRRQLDAHFPEAVFIPRENVLQEAWQMASGDEALAVEFGLGSEFMLPLAVSKLDPFIGLIGALSGLQESEFGLFQVIWQAVQNPWGESILRSVTHDDGRPFFLNMPVLANAAETKTSRPLFAAIVRILVRAAQFNRVLQMACDLAASLRVFSDPNGNHLIPLRNDGYPLEEHFQDALRRQTRRTGMILNSDELVGLVHLPGDTVRSGVLVRRIGRAREAPPTVRQLDGLAIGDNEYAGVTTAAHLSPEQRVRHCHIIGASGTGKSTLLFNLIKQDIDSGQGIAVLDPHGDLIDRILGEIPENRVEDVVLVDPSDEEYSVGFNILSAHSELEKTLLASDLIAVFERLSSSWGDQMNSVLQNAILAFLESSHRGTIADMRRFLIEPSFRSEFLESVRDSEIVYYWQKSFPHLVGNKSIGSILTRLDAFLSKKPIRYMVNQPENRLDFADVMDTGKIFLAKLPEGLLGRENSYLLGTLLVSKFQQLAMSRQAKNAASRRNFWIYIDEFANFITPSMAEILSGARKYRIGLTLAHHELHQLDRNKEVASAVLSHPCTRIVFRVGDDDAKKLADGFSHFEAADLRNLGVGEAICRVERSDFDFNLAVRPACKNDDEIEKKRRDQAINASRRKYAKLRSEVDALLAQALKASQPTTASVRAAKPAPKTAEDVTAVTPEPKQVSIVPPVPEQNLAQVEPSSPSKQAEPAPSTTEPKIVKVVPKDLGKGGARHRAIQAWIKTAAEKLGFRSTIETPIPNSRELIDIFLERGEERIACEICITTTIDHEIGNILKCLKAGIPRIAVLSTEDLRLRKIEAATKSCIEAEPARRISYFLPEAFIQFLETLPAPVLSPSEKVVKGYKVKSKLSLGTPEDQKNKHELALKIITEAMRKKL